MTYFLFDVTLAFLKKLIAIIIPTKMVTPLFYALKSIIVKVSDSAIII